MTVFRVRPPIFIVLYLICTDMLAKIKSVLQALLGGFSDIDETEEAHPLNRPKEDHQIKNREAEEKLKRLRTKRDKLKEKLEKKKSKYKKEKQAGNESASDILTDAKEIKDTLETTRGQINEVEQQRTYTSNILRSYKIRETHDDAYWQELKEMDERTLFGIFSEEEMETQEILGMLDKGKKASARAVDSYNERTSQMSSQSNLESEWNDEIEEETTVSTEDVVGSVERDFGEAETETADDDIKLN